MQENHEMFTQAVKDNRKITLIYYSDVEKSYLKKLVIPIYFRSSNSRWDTDIYSFWDSQAKSSHLLVLASTQIKSIELSDKAFGKADCFIP